MLNQVVTNKYFMELGEIVQSLNLQDKPECIWNRDETSISLCHKPTKIYAQKGMKNIPGRVANSREIVTFVACVNALGNEIPPLVVLKGKTQVSLSSFNVAESPAGTKFTC